MERIPMHLNNPYTGILGEADTVFKIITLREFIIKTTTTVLLI